LLVYILFVKCRIYSSILETHLIPFPDEVNDVGKKITPITMQFYRQLIAKMPPTPSKFHYIFNLRDLSRVSLLAFSSSPIPRIASVDQVVSTKTIDYHKDAFGLQNHH
jgi:hypothetical protein